MSDKKIPNPKREFEEEASSKIVSPLKKTKLNDYSSSSSDSHVVVFAASSSSSVSFSEASASVECSITSTKEENDHSSSIISVCVSSESKEIAKNSSSSVLDLEVHQISETETETIIISNFRKETSPVSEGLGETTAELESLSATKRKDDRKISSEVSKRTPTTAEIEDFFSELENVKQKQFIEKYNFDIVNDEPLEGRYEWDRVKP